MTKVTFLALSLIAVAALMHVLLLQNQNQNPVRTPWADQWTQQFETHADGSQTWSGGLVYYSWKLKAYKMTYQRSVYSPCSQFAGYLSECSYLFFENSSYIFWPAKKICLFYNESNFPFPQYIAGLFVYKNTTTINETDYYVWNYQYDDQYFIYTSTDKRQINFWQYQLRQNMHYNEYRYIDKSYYPGIEKQVFQIPQFCQNASKEISLNNQQKDSFKKMLNIQNNFSLRK